MIVLRRHSRLSLAFLAFLLGSPSLPAQSLPGDGGEPTVRAQRVRLFRISPAFSAEPLGLYEAEDVPGVTSKTDTTPAAADDGPDWLLIAMGSDNPYLDFRQPGDPGGLGYYRIYTQMQLFETAQSGCALNVQAVTPAGIQYWGLPNGPTVFRPSLSFFQAVNSGLAMQGFIGKNVVVSDAACQPCLQRRIECGLGVQQQLNSNGLYLSLEGLAQTPPTHEAIAVPPSLQVLPGMQWQVDEALWLSSGVLVPAGPQHHQPGRWQMTCSFQF